MLNIDNINRFEQLCSYDGEKNDNYLIYENFTKSELNSCLLVERQGISAFKYNNVINEILKFCNHYIKNNKPNNFFINYEDIPCEEYKIIIPYEITNKIDFIKELNLEIKVINYLTNNSFKDNSNGKTISNKYDSIIDVNGNYKLNDTKIYITCQSINNEIINNTFLVTIYHELNHAYENYNRLINYFKGKTNELGLYDNLKKINYQKRISLLFNKEYYDFGVILYYLWTKSEFNSFSTALYAELKSINSKRENFTKDLNNLKAFKNYNIIKQYVLKLHNINDEHKWKHVINIIYPNYKGNYQTFKNSFIKRTNILLNSLFKKMIKSAILYYDEIDELNDKDKKNIKIY